MLAMNRLLATARRALAIGWRAGLATRLHPTPVPGLLALLLLVPGTVGATNYKFPGKMPATCAGHAGAYTCSTLILAPGDTVVFKSQKPATLKVSGRMDTSDASINSDGLASDLDLSVVGTLTLGNGAVINANISAAGIDASAGQAQIEGNLASTSAAVMLGDQTQVTGSISSATYVDIGLSSSISGNIDAPSGQVDLRDNCTVGGNITTTDSNITLGQGTAVGGNLTATSGTVSITALAKVTGLVKTTAGNIALGQSASVGATAQFT